jgi:hypothetical protein
MYAKNELMFPTYVIPKVKDMRSDDWRSLVERVTSLPETHPESLAFSLMMIRLGGCMECETDSYRAMRGCAMCAAQTLRRYKGTDRDLVEKFNDAYGDIVAFLEQQNPSVRVA